MEPGRLSYELRNGGDESLQRRRKVVGLSLAAAGSMAVISLYQMGLIKRLPEPPIPGLDAEKVDSSEEAYAHLQAPDALIGLKSYALTAFLAGAGEPQRARTMPWLPLAMAAKTVFDAAQAGKLTRDQWVKHRAFCSWCLMAAAASFAMVPLTMPEAKEALRQLLGHNRR